jgi:hypothetical protein
MARCYKLWTMTRDELDEAYEATVKEIGEDPESRLKWLLVVIQTPFAQIPDWRKLRVALAAFSPGNEGFSGSEKEIDKPTEEEAKVILFLLGDAIKAAATRQRIDFGPVQSEPQLIWDETSRSFREYETVTDWKSRAVQALKRLLVQCGHLIKACEAKKPRSEELCGNWFLATRRGQRYCGPACASRESTRQVRSSVATKPTKKRKAKKKKRMKK